MTRIIIFQCVCDILDLVASLMRQTGEVTLKRKRGDARELRGRNSMDKDAVELAG